MSFSLFFALLTPALSDDCDLLDLNSLSNTVSSIGKPVKSILSGKFGFEAAPDNLSDALDRSKTVPYIIGEVGLGLFILAFAILIIIYSLIGCCCFCCCCKPEKNETPRLLQPLTICHIITIAFLAVSVVFFCLGASTLSNGVGSVADAPSSVVGNVTALTKKISSIVEDIFGAVLGKIDEVDTILSGLGNLETDADTNNGLAKEIYCAGTGDTACTEGSPIPKLINYDSTVHQNGLTDNDIKGACLQEEGSVIEADSKVITLLATYVGTKEAIENSCTTLESELGNIKSVAQKASENKDGTIKDAKDRLDGTKNGDIKSGIDNLDKIKNDVNKQVEPYIDTLDKVKKYMRIVVIVATVLYSLCVVGFGVAYFFNSCCSLCFISCDWCFFIIIAVLLLIPGAIFGILSIILTDNCPVLEVTVGSLLKDSFPIPKEDLAKVFKCEQMGSVYDMADMKKFFDIKKISDEIEQNINGINVNIDTKGLDNSFNQFGGDLTPDKITTANMWPNYESVLTQEGLSNQCKEKAQQLLTNIRATLNGQPESADLITIKTNMKTVLAFGRSIPGTVQTIETQTKVSTSSLGTILSTHFNDGVKSITCNYTKCVYSPVKNPVCHYLANGASEWALSSIFAIIGVVVLSIVFMFRRKGMAQQDKKGKSDDEDTSSSCSDSFT